MNNSQDKSITIVGCGPGNRKYLTQIAFEKVNEADLLIGSKRLLAIFPESEAEQLPVERDYALLAEKIKSSQKKRIVILVSGDPGFFSLAKLLVKKLGPENCNVIPGISSSQLAFARIGENWNDAKFFSLHGRDKELDDLANVIRDNNKIAILTDDINNPAKIAGIIELNCIAVRKAYVFENLSMENEAVHEYDLQSMSKADIKGMNIVIILK